MTSREISEFVNQPVPRKVPGKFFRAAIDKKINVVNYKLMFILIFALLFYMYLVRWSMFSDILLDRGYKDTAQGAITSMTREGGRYRLYIRFHTPGGEIEANCYVSHRRDIPGWGVIPETLNEPFPVTIEYIPWRPSVARAVGTRSSDSAYFLNLIRFIMLFALICVLFRIFLDFRRIKRLLSKGLFAAGHIYKYVIQGNSSSFSVNFIDQRGMKQTTFFTVPNSASSACRKWADENRSIGLLYLPGKDKILVTDLWLKETVLPTLSNYEFGNTDPRIIDFLLFCQSGSLYQVTDAIKNGADVNTSFEGVPSLMWAAGSNPDPEVIKALIKAGAYVNVRNTGESTPLMFAAMNPNANPDVIIALLELGANPKAKDDSGRMAIDLARKNEKLKNTEALRRLEEASR